MKEHKFDLEISLMVTGYDLKCAISAKCGVNAGRLKTICNGRVIDDSAALGYQDVKVGRHIVTQVAPYSAQSLNIAD